MAMGTATMAASSARWCAREGNRGGNGVQGERGEVQGARGSAWRHQRLGEEAGGGQSRVEVARTAASRCPRPSGKEEDDRGVAVAGWAVLLGQVGYQVSAR